MNTDKRTLEEFRRDGEQASLIALVVPVLWLVVTGLILLLV